MHLYVLARGIQTAMDQWVNDVSAIFLPIEYEKGKMGKVRVAVRPVQMYEIVFPEKHEDFMLGAISHNDHDKIKGKWVSLLAGALRNALGAKDTRKLPANGAIYNPYVHITHIGIKKDDHDKDGIEIL